MIGGRVERGEVSACAARLRWMCAPLEPESGSLASCSNPTQPIQSHYQIGNYNPYPSIDVDHLMLLAILSPVRCDFTGPRRRYQYGSVTGSGSVQPF